MASDRKHRRIKSSPIKDTRLLVGIALILLSMIVGGFTLSSLAATSKVLVAKENITIGQELKPQSFEIREVRLENAEEHYVANPEQIPNGSLSLRAVGAGEMLPKGAVGQAGDSELRPISLEVDDTVAASLSAGAITELWVAINDDTVETLLLVERAIVRSVDSGSGFRVSSTKVEVLVPQRSLPKVLESIAAGHSIYVVEVPGEFEVRK